MYKFTYSLNLSIIGSFYSKIKYILIFSFMVFLQNIGHSFDQNHEITKSINKSFRVSKTGNLIVGNQYGNIKIETWDRDEVSFQVDIKVSANTKSRAEEAMDRISISFSNSSSEVKAMTVIEDLNTSGFWSWFGKNSQSFKIHYFIKCPKSMNLEIGNKYGNINLPDWSGNVDINLKYGNITSQNITAKTKLFLSYGDLNMKNLGDLNFVVKYSDGNILSCQNAELLLAYSDINITNVQTIKSDNNYSNINIDLISNYGNFSGNYNDYKIKEVANLDMKGNYSDLIIHNLLSSLDTKLAYGGVSIKNVSPSTKSIKFDGSYTELNIRNMKNYTLKYNGSNSTLSLPTNFEYRTKEKEAKSFKCEGSEGNGKTNVLINSKYGDITIK